MYKRDWECNILKWRDLVIKAYGSISEFPDRFSVEWMRNEIQGRVPEVDGILKLVHEHPGVVAATTIRRASTAPAGRSPA